MVAMGMRIVVKRFESFTSANVRGQPDSIKLLGSAQWDHLVSLPHTIVADENMEVCDSEGEGHGMTKMFAHAIKVQGFQVFMKRTSNNRFV